MKVLKEQNQIGKITFNLGRLPDYCRIEFTFERSYSFDTIFNSYGMVRFSICAPYTNYSKLNGYSDFYDPLNQKDTEQ